MFGPKTCPCAPGRTPTRAYLIRCGSKPPGRFVLNGAFPQQVPRPPHCPDRAPASLLGALDSIYDGHAVACLGFAPFVVGTDVTGGCGVLGGWLDRVECGGGVGDTGRSYSSIPKFLTSGANTECILSSLSLSHPNWSDHSWLLGQSASIRV